MVVRGRVQNGIIVLEGGMHLPEGREVTVLSPSSAGLAGPGTHISTGELPHRSASDGSRPPRSVLDIPPVYLGPVLRPFDEDVDLLEEMLEGRR